MTCRTVARSAARAAVPLYLIGVGDASEPPDLILSDLRAEDSINVNDRLVMEARVSSQGASMPDSVPSSVRDERVSRSRLPARWCASTPEGKPVKVRFVHQPKEAGEKTFVIEIPTQADESRHYPNRIEHRDLRSPLRSDCACCSSRAVRVMTSATSRRCSSAKRKQFAATSRSTLMRTWCRLIRPSEAGSDAINRFPTPEELRKYDVVILGDVSPKQLPRAEANLDALAKFVKNQGGGLISWLANMPIRTRIAIRRWPTSCR